ncbi:phage tail sheath family protein [Undibacterium umbellatum]|uniref:Phage tail sheath family protein n=1 Tax=Undibacterium umbellatum TaxID=2762300 RepID=A0ABR6Z4H4_9BURK|nr:phage tail sheath family protein [Undibacterium umbellatum]MBC3906696.1 phage tail sheath family protein [Undibacterium umbellatum]
MIQQLATPGVYATEVDGFSSAVVAVPTGIPVFVGYTAEANGEGKPIPISSLSEYISIFGAAPQIEYDYVSNTQAMPPYRANKAAPAFGLYFGLQLFFNNGGGVCYILSLGTYGDVIAAGTFGKDAYTSALAVAAACTEADLLVMPDAVQLSLDDWASVSQMALQSCEQAQHLMCVLDVLNGYLPADGSAQDPVTGGTGNGGFYRIAGLGDDFNKYGVSYYPWLNTNIVSISDIDYSWVSAGTLPLLVADLNTEAATLFPADAAGNATKLQAYISIVALLPQTGDAVAVRQRHQSLMALSPLYQSCMNNIVGSVNLLPPAAAMAGVYARTDHTFGVFQAPANTTIINALSPAVTVTDQQQTDLNMPLNGMAVNAIRTFPNYGLLVWGARTLAGNSDDWRYINVRRTMIMLEQSIKTALQSCVFQANDSLTWASVNASISSFLNALWKEGALAGSKPDEAYSVRVGLGSTMTGQDILDGLMKVTVSVALTHPAEFIVLTFQQQMQTS